MECSAALAEETCGWVWGSSGHDGEIGVRVGCRHEEGFARPVRRGVLDDAEGVDPEKGS